MTILRPRLIAEIGQNHNGYLPTAIQMIEAFRGGIGHPIHVAFKGQLRDVREFPAVWETMPHPTPANAYGSNYAEHRMALELDDDAHRTLADQANTYGHAYGLSVWGERSLMRAMSILKGRTPASFIKVPSAHNQDFALLAKVAYWEGPIHVSLGMIYSWREVAKLVAFAERYGFADRLVLYHCVSGYPVPAELSCLSTLEQMRGRYVDPGRVGAIGYSGHHNGIALDVAALMLGASYIERHVTLDRTQRGTDHAAALEPSGFHKLRRDLLAVYDAVAVSGVRFDPYNLRIPKLLELEEPTRAKFRLYSDAPGSPAPTAQIAGAPCASTKLEQKTDWPEVMP